jgi:hypothetical protein
MAKRGSAAQQGNSGVKKTTASGDAMEQRVVAFAEQLGRIVGTVQAKAEGWMDRETLNRQIASVRDGAADLLDQLTRGAKKVARKKSQKPAARTARGASRGRSGGVVDAPGKRHRKPMPADPDAKRAASQAAKMRTAMPMAKTNRRRGRG